MDKRIKFNIIDFSIVLFAVLVILAAVFWDDLREKFSYDEVTAEYTFKIVNLSEAAYNSITANDKITFVDNGADAGVIIEINGQKENKDILLADGSKKTYEADTYVVTGKARAQGRMKENGFYLDGKYFVVPGKKFDVQTIGTTFQIEVISLSNK